MPNKTFENFRPVSLLSVINKIFETLLLGVIVPLVDHKLPPGMIAYRRDCSTFLGLVLVDDVVIEIQSRGKKAMVILRDVETGCYNYGLI